MDKVTVTLKPCPFCGGDAELMEGRKGQAGCFEPIFDAQCSECLCRTYDWKDTKDEAIAAWNTRQAEEQNKLLREALEEIATSAFGNGPLSRDRDAHTLSMIEKHARRALEATNG